MFRLDVAGHPFPAARLPSFPTLSVPSERRSNSLRPDVPNSFYNLFHAHAARPFYQNEIACFGTGAYISCDLLMALDPNDRIRL
jgi:hypothetical protein